MSTTIESKFAKLTPQNQFSTLINLMSVKNPVIKNELVTNKNLDDIIFGSEIRRIVVSKMLGNGNLSASKMLLQSLDEKVQWYSKTFDNEEIISLYAFFINNLDVQAFENTVIETAEKEQSYIERSLYSKTDLKLEHKIINWIINMNYSDKNEIEIGLGENNHNAALIIANSRFGYRRSERYISEPLLTFRGSSGFTLASIIDKTYSNQNMKGTLQVHDQNVSFLNIDDVVELSPSFVALSLPADNILNYSAIIINELKKRLPKTPVIAGGKIFGPVKKQNKPENRQFEEVAKYLLETTQIDSIGIGNAENILPDFIKDALSGKTKQIYIGNEQNPMPPLLYSKKIGTLGIKPPLIVSTGCKPNPCSYCSNGKFYGGFSQKSLSTIERDILSLHAEVELNGRISVFIPDDNPWSPLISLKKTGEGTFCDKEERINRILNLFKKHSVEFYSFVDGAVAKDFEQMQKLRDGGMKGVIIGIDSISPEILKYYKKQDNISNYQTIADNMNKLGIYSVATVVFDPRQDNIETATLTGRTLKEMGYDFFVPFIATPFFGTKLSLDLEDDLINPLLYAERKNLSNQIFRTENNSMKSSSEMLYASRKEFYSSGFLWSHLRNIARKEFQFNNWQKENGRVPRGYVETFKSLAVKAGFSIASSFPGMKGVLTQ
ncbi:MAG: hypothetical protein ABH828_01415 [archaeon]